jgi:hypothetical protein
MLPLQSYDDHNALCVGHTTSRWSYCHCDDACECREFVLNSVNVGVMAALFNVSNGNGVCTLQGTFNGQGVYCYLT